MKLQDKETLSIATAVKDVLEKKTVKEIKYPHKMYSPDGKEVTANNKEEHEKFSAKGYTHEKPVEESPEEPRAAGEKEFKAKHAVKKSGMNPDGTNVKEGKVVRLDEPEEIQTEDEELSPKQKKYQAFFQKALKKFGVKSPSELDGDKKKEFFDYVDKNYDAGEGETDKDESKKPKKEAVTIKVDTALLEDTETYPGVNDLTAEAMIDAAIKSGLKVKWQVNKDKSGVDVQITGNNDKGWSKFFKIADKENEKHLTGRDAYEPKMSNKYNKYKGKFKAESVEEAKKPGRGKTTQDIDYIGDRSHAKTAEKKHKIKIKVTGRSTADITGEKKDIIAYLKDPDLYGMDDLDIEDIYPELYK